VNTIFLQFSRNEGLHKPAEDFLKNFFEAVAGRFKGQSLKLPAAYDHIPKVRARAALSHRIFW
jgi:hypothetical protein